MPCTIAELLKKLRKEFKIEYISISPAYDIFFMKNNIEIEYSLYISDHNEHCHVFKSLNELKHYVEYICKPLTVNDVLNAGGETLIVD